MVKDDEDKTAELGVIELEDNLADAEKPPELPNGIYTAELQDVQMKTSGKGNDYFAVKFVIGEKDLPGTVSEHYPDGAVLFWNRQIVPKKGDARALFSLKQFVLALGLDANITSVDPNEWMGRSARVKVRQEKYQNEMRAQIVGVEAAEAAPRAASRAPAKAAARGRGR